MTTDPAEYERLTAIVSYTIITRSIETAFPDLSPRERNAMFVNVIDRLARMRGWSIRREHVMSEDDE